MGVERPLLDKYIVPTTWREIGAGITGNIPNANLKYQAYIVNGFSSYNNGPTLRGSDALRKGRQKGAESFMSTPNLTAKVERYSKLLVRAQDIDGKTWEFPAEDFFARVIQHELDHINGILFIDHLSSLKRTLYKKRLKKILREQEEGSF
ncbi:MAG: peptide deformylase [Desulfobulbaceae bacterium]